MIMQKSENPKKFHLGPFRVSRLIQWVYEVWWQSVQGCQSALLLNRHTHTDTHTLAGPALFRRRLRAFQKCTAGVAASQKIASREEQQYFTPVHTPRQSDRDKVHSSSNFSFPSNFHFRKPLFFSLISYPAEITYFSSPNREISNGAWLVELY